MEKRELGGIFTGILATFILGACASPSAAPVDGRTEVPCQRHVYIDLGVNWANTLRLFETMQPRKANLPWDVFGFEASPLIQPYAERFCAWLNGEHDQPKMCLPPSGSTHNLASYSRAVGCRARSLVAMRACML